MYRVTFCGGESTGGVADRKIETAKQESTGGVGIRTNNQTPEITMKSLDRDTVSFKSAYQSKNSDSSLFAVIAGVGFTAAAIIAGLGCAKKYNLVNKIPNQEVKNFVVKYGAEPCYKICANTKSFTKEMYTKTVNYFNGKNVG